MLPSKLFSLIAAHLVARTYCATPDEWRSRSIYQIITDRFERDDGNHGYICDTGARVRCGGTWAGIQRHLDYIHGMGFDAIWISPVQKSINFSTLYGDGYAGYYIQDFTKTNDYMGTPQDLKNLVIELHKRGMFMMVDTVPNHMAGHPIQPGETLQQIDFSGYVPFNKPEQFHTPCPINGNDPQSVVNCWLGDDAVPLMDLNTDDPSVAAELNSIVDNLVSAFKIDGVRVDAVKHIKHDFWKPYNEAAGVFAMGEVFSGQSQVFCPFQSNGLDGMLNFGIWGGLMSSLTSPYNTLNDLSDAITSVDHDCVDTNLLGSFMENHDVARWRAMTQDESLILNVLTFTFISDGIPIVYYGFEQNFNGDSKLDGNREALWTSNFDTSTVYYKRIAALNLLRKSIITSDPSYTTTRQHVIATNPRWLAVHKGDVLLIVTNLGASGSSAVTVPSPWADGTKVAEFYSSQKITIFGGNLQTTIHNGMPMIWMPETITLVSSSSISSSNGPSSVHAISAGANNLLVGINGTNRTSTNGTFLGNPKTPASSSSAASKTNSAPIFSGLMTGLVALAFTLTFII